MICDLLALRPILHITKKTLPYLHSTKIEQMTKTMVIFKRGAIFLCCIRCDPIPQQTSVQRLAHTRNVTTCCSFRLVAVAVIVDSLDGQRSIKIKINKEGNGIFFKLSFFFKSPAFLLSSFFFSITT